MLYFHFVYYYYYYYFVRRMSVLSSSLFVLAPVYHCSLVVLLNCAVSWINKQNKVAKHVGYYSYYYQAASLSQRSGLQSSNFPVNDLSVRTYVHRSVCLVHCGKMADRIRIPFGIIGRTGPGMRFGDRSTGRGTFGDEFGARSCKQWGLYGICVRQCRDAAFFPNYFGQTCFLLL